jgi:hypothetical protein
MITVPLSRWGGFESYVTGFLLSGIGENPALEFLFAAAARIEVPLKSGHMDKDLS